MAVTARSEQDSDLTSAMRSLGFTVTSNEAFRLYKMGGSPFRKLVSAAGGKSQLHQSFAGPNAQWTHPRAEEKKGRRPVTGDGARPWRRMSNNTPAIKNPSCRTDSSVLRSQSRLSSEKVHQPPATRTTHRKPQTSRKQSPAFSSMSNRCTKKRDASSNNEVWVRANEKRELLSRVLQALSDSESHVSSNRVKQALRLIGVPVSEREIKLLFSSLDGPKFCGRRKESVGSWPQESILSSVSSLARPTSSGVRPDPPIPAAHTSRGGGSRQFARLQTGRLSGDCAIPDEGRGGVEASEEEMAVTHLDNDDGAGSSEWESATHGAEHLKLPTRGPGRVRFDEGSESSFSLRGRMLREQPSAWCDASETCGDTRSLWDSNLGDDHGTIETSKPKRDYTESQRKAATFLAEHGIENVTALKHHFRRLDAEKDGVLTAPEFCRAVVNAGIVGAPKAANDLFAAASDLVEIAVETSNSTRGRSGVGGETASIQYDKLTSLLHSGSKLAERSSVPVAEVADVDARELLHGMHSIQSSRRPVRASAVPQQRSPRAWEGRYHQWSDDEYDEDEAFSADTLQHY